MKAAQPLGSRVCCIHPGRLPSYSPAILPWLKSSGEERSSHSHYGIISGSITAGAKHRAAPTTYPHPQPPPPPTEPVVAPSLVASHFSLDYHLTQQFWPEGTIGQKRCAVQRRLTSNDPLNAITHAETGNGTRLSPGLWHCANVSLAQQRIPELQNLSCRDRGFFCY